MKVYGYVRVSGKSQLDGHGFKRQEQAIKDYCKANRLELVEVYREEAVSGTTDEGNRPSFQTMLSAILSNGVRAIVVEGLDRLAREYRVQESLLIYLASKGVDLINARTGENVVAAVVDDPMKKALVQMQGVFAELEKSLLVKKLRLAREAKRKTVGKCEGQKSIKEANPEIIQAVRSGLRRKLTHAAIADELNTNGILTKSGKPWTAANVQSVVKRWTGSKTRKPAA
jgi:DNA invertase Pin-like site-specific DNA recombinase